MSREVEGFGPFEKKMREENLPDLAIRTFRYYYERLVSGDTGLLAEDEIEPVQSLPDAEELEEGLRRKGREALEESVMIKLNGGLGTSMGLDRAKSLLKVKEDYSFLDIIAQQAIKGQFSLVLMNSFATNEDSLDALQGYPDLNDDLPLAFLQHKVPKVKQEDLTPVEHSNPDLEWCPPGHGDIYNALRTSEMLSRMLEAGHRYAFVSNSDNLGAVLDEKILGYFISQEIPFMMEVADRTDADRKGGHLARLADGSGRLVLRESAQCPPEDMDSFQDISRHVFFNTNNLWIDLERLAQRLEETDFLKLPMIRNSKTVDPQEPDSTPVYQLETAMGAAIYVFEDSQALRVPRTRFAPVKTCNDLLTVRSDATHLTERFRIEPNPARELRDNPVVELDERFYKLIDSMEARFPKGPPSLLRCKSLEVKGDFQFGADVAVEGAVELLNTTDRQMELPDGTVVSGVMKYTE